MRNGYGSFWLDNTIDEGGPRPPLDHDASYDVAIVGGGLTGLWTAYWLKRKDPRVRVAVLEQNRVGFGASGRNGGWLSSKPIGLRRRLAKSSSGYSAVSRMEDHCRDAVYEVSKIFAEKSIDIDASLSGWMHVARKRSELDRLIEQVAEERSWGVKEEDLRLLSSSEAKERVNVSQIAGAMYSPHALRVNPAKLVYGLASLCEEVGVTIYESSRVVAIDNGVVRTERASVQAEMVVLATEGYTTALPGRKRDLLPMRSCMIVTQPMDEASWEEIGWANGECMGGAQHMYFYSQPTKDGRIALGGRGIPYYFGSQIDNNGQVDEKTIARLSGVLRSLFPEVEIELDHAWQGVLGVSRDWSPFVELQTSDKLLKVGGYAGQGVTGAYIGGRTASDLVLGERTELSESAWVRPAPRRWEFEPLRWAGATSVYKLYEFADKKESRSCSGKTAAAANFANWLAGR